MGGTVMVVGGAGYVGSHTARVLRDAGRHVIVYDGFLTGHRAAVKGFEVVEGRLQDTDLLAKTMKDHEVEKVIHFAAYIAVGESWEDPGKYYSNNIGGGISLLEAMRASGIASIVFSSSAAVYGTPEEVPIPEGAPKKPESPYGHTKLVFEQIMESYAKAYGFAAMALRYFNAAGAHSSGEIGEDHRPETHLIPLVLAAARDGGEIKVFGTDFPTPDGTAIRDYVHIEDLADAHVKAIEKMKQGEFRAYNVGVGSGYSVREVIDCARKVTGREIRAVDSPRRAGDVARLVAASDTIRTELGWVPAHENLEEIVASAWRWHREHPGGFG